MEDKEFVEFKEKWDKMQDNFGNMFAPLRHNVIAYATVDGDYDGFFCEIIDDLETFYDVSKYPAVEVAISLLRDYYREFNCHYPSRKTLQLLKNWRKQK